ncbi:MAG: DUF2177 family protein [Pseudomonadota bacterium]
MIYAAAYLGTGFGFLVLDIIWLGFLAQPFYQREIGVLLLEKFNMGAAAAFYLMYIAGVVIFAVSPALHSGSWKTALVLGALLGFFAYATYNLTNLATLKGWSMTMAMVDISWGAVLTGLAALFGYAVARMFAGN